jgi:hypothetical protein
MYRHYKLTHMQLFTILTMTFEAENLMHSVTLLILTDRTPHSRIIVNGKIKNFYAVNLT